MKTNPRSIIWSLLWVIAVAISSCNLGPTEKEITIKQQWYSIDSSTILESIRQGKKDVFKLVGDSPPEYVLSSWSSGWTQDDFLLIANTLHKAIWNEGLESWSLHQMDFTLNCDKVGVGFYNARFEFFKVETTAGQESRIVHNLTIEPGLNSASIWDRVFSPKVMNWATIDLKKIEISADQAIQIAEDNGGYEVRTAVNNACSISIFLSPGAVRYKEWTITYQKGRTKRIFDLEIDPYTGEIR